MARGFFRRIASRPYRRERNEREDRLTELLAAVLEHEACHDLPRYLVEGWISEVERGRVLLDTSRADSLRGALEASAAFHVETQKRIDGGERRADLVLGFESAIGTSLTVCVEAKLDAKPDRDQLDGYLRWMATARPGAHLMILMGPRSAYAGYDQRQIPIAVARIPWESTAQILRDYYASVELTPVSRFLVGELLTYMKDEEDLVDPERLSPEHLKALDLRAEADAACERLYEIAEEYILAHGEKRQAGEHQLDREDECYGIGLDPYPVTLPPNKEDAAPGLWFEVYWDGKDCFPLLDSHVPALTVGMYKQAWMDGASLESLAEAGFREYERGLGNYSYDDELILRVISVDSNDAELLAEATLEAQGRAVAEWVLSGLRDLRAALQAPAVQEAMARI